MRFGKGGGGPAVWTLSDFERADFARRLAGKPNEGRYFVLREAILCGKTVLHRDFGKLYRALRHFDAVGASNEISAFLEETDADSLSFGSAEIADFSAVEE